jgi:predicted DsbA family dithiol-disulfide isomerase
MEAGLAAAAELGVSAVPTFVVGNKFAIQGAQEAAVFRQAFERLSSGL